MRFAKHPRRPLPESVVPMINVVFLLLIFFLMSARLAPAPSLDVQLPSAISDGKTEEKVVMYLGADGDPAIGQARGEAVWQALASLPSGGKLTLRADADVSAVDVAKTLARLAGLGISEVELAVRPR
ncbi:biopolymer transporter ExbD [Pseudorhodobacter sp.]|uniref:ExbD/TolR family protein n=1 Tax=Pseudorhodobacter sp. TaxID=1934400 RepID=UPI0026494C23|nr:biopolymer transporter ExbD [Pseudorhodobacter sp.]MDN5788604.1 biopolymer transporter ExbD [Pseudorhodobacter sp.]